MYIIEAKGVTKYFGGLAAVDHVDFEIEEGEILGLIGPNGAGKTTLLNCINHVFPIDGGDILFEGKSIVGLKPHRIAKLGIGRTFQIVEPFTSMTVKQNVMVSALFGRGGRGKSVADAMRDAEEALDFLRMADRADDPVQELTVPDMKRLELARAWALQPKLLLLDEVMAGLNPAEIEEAMALIRQVRDTGITIMLIEHVMRAIMGVCERVMVLHHGKKIAVGACDEIANNDAVIEAYLGEKYAKRKRHGQTLT